MPSRARAGRGCQCRTLGVGDQLSVDGIRYPPLEAAHRLHRLLAVSALASVVGASVGVQAELGDRGDVDHVVHPSVSGTGEAVTVLLTGGGIKGRGAGPGGEPIPIGEPSHVADVREDPGRHHGPDAMDLHQTRVTGQHHRLELGGGLLDLRVNGDQLCELLRGDATSGLSCDVAGTDAGEHHLGLQGSDVLLGLAWEQFGEQCLEPVNGLDPAPGQRLTAVGEQAHRLQLTVDLQDAQRVGADRDDRDRVSVERVGLPVVAGVEQPDPGGELGRHIDNMFPSFEEPLGERTSNSVSALDGPDPVRPGLRVLPHRGVASLVGAESTRPQQRFVLIDDLDRGR